MLYESFANPKRIDRYGPAVRHTAMIEGRIVPDGRHPWYHQAQPVYDYRDT
jgi:hypothetical protein